MILKQKRARVCCKVLAWFLFLTVSALIFGFSHQSAEESSKVSQSVLFEVLEKLIPGYNEMTKEEQECLIETYHSLIRKTAHFGIYTLWGWSFSFLLSLYRKRKKAIAVTVLCGGLLYAAGDEVHQMFVNGRAAQLFDVMIDTLGSGFGFFCFILFGKIVNYFLNYTKKALT